MCKGPLTHSLHCSEFVELTLFYITQKEIMYVGSTTAPEVAGFTPMKVRLCTAGGSIPII